jgi:hypothetical protein
MIILKNSDIIVVSKYRFKAGVALGPTENNKIFKNKPAHDFKPFPSKYRFKVHVICLETEISSN